MNDLKAKGYDIILLIERHNIEITKLYEELKKINEEISKVSKIDPIE